MNNQEIKCGANATLKIEKIKGMITGICTRFDKDQYEFSYFYNGDIKTIWLNKNEFIVEEIKATNIGFSQ